MCSVIIDIGSTGEWRGEVKESGGGGSHGFVPTPHHDARHTRNARTPNALNSLSRLSTRGPMEIQKSSQKMPPEVGLTLPSSPCASGTDQGLVVS